MNAELHGRLVFASGRAGDFDIWPLDIDTGALSQLTRGSSLNEYPRWSPDGHSIVYVSNQSGVPELWLMDEDGQNQRQLTSQRRFHSFPNWSPDGRQIICCANYGSPEEVEVWAIDIDSPNSTTRIVAAPGMETHPSLSPDGSRVLLSSSRSGNYDIWEYEIKTAAWRQITSHPGKDFGPVYSPDGLSIAFVSRPSLKEDSELWIVDGAGQKPPLQLTRNAHMDQHIAWSPDGRYLVYCSAKAGPGTSRLSVLEVQTQRISALDYDRNLLELEIDAVVRDYGILTRLMPDSIQRRFVDKSYFGSERCPDWTA